ncbi:hypothetical protein SCB49_04935 [unidentified eubacterium SCB49]|nr:hypothetical protein SCB49_04935 [unidentified eubacterium SCB49]
MKKITFLAALIVSVVSFSQTPNSVVLDSGLSSNTSRVNNPVVAVQEIEIKDYNPSDYSVSSILSQGVASYPLVDGKPIVPNRGNCDSSNASNAFEDGRGCNAANGWTAANDIIVADGTDAVLNSITPNIFLGVGVTVASVDVVIYDDAGGLPGAVVETQLGVVPTSHTVVGNNFGLDINSVEIDLSPVTLVGATGSDTTYWVAIQVTTSDSTVAYWENSTASAEGAPLAFDDTTGWIVPDAAQDGVYTYNVDCAPIGGGGGNCDSSNASNAFENGRGCNAANGWTAANDIIVADGYDTELSSITPNIFLGVGVTVSSVNVVIYDDAGGLPGAVVDSQLGVVPASHTVLGNNFGFDINEVVINLSPVTLAGATGSDTTYWIAIQVTTSDSSVAYWEVSTITSVGEDLAFDDGTGWVIGAVGEDGVYTFTADCEEFLNVSDVAFQDFSMFPNPTVDVLNLESRNVIENVTIFNMLGQKVLSQGFDSTTVNLDVANLTTGSYIVNVTIDGVSANFNLLKK